MTTLSDAKLSALETLTGATGHVNDLEQLYLSQLVTGPAVSDTIQDLWDQVFTEAAIPAGQFNDRWFAYMDFILAPATENAYMDRQREYWDGGGTPLGPPLPQPGNLRHEFDAGQLATLFSHPTLNFKPSDGGTVFRWLNLGTDGTQLEEALGNPAPRFIENPTGLNPITAPSVLRFDASKLEQLLATIAAGLPSGVGTGYAIAIVLRGREDPPITSRAFTWGDSVVANNRILGAGVRAPANDFGDVLLNSNVVVTEQPPFTTPMTPFNWFGFVGTVLDDGSGIQDNFIAARRGLTPFTGTINSQASQGRPAALDRFIVGNQSSGGVPWDGDIAKIWVWDVGFIQADVDQMLTYLDFFYPDPPLTSFPAAGIPTLPPATPAPTTVTHVRTPASSGPDTIEGILPNIIELFSDAWSNQGVYAGYWFKEQAPGVLLGAGQPTFQTTKVGNAVFADAKATVRPNIAANFGPQLDGLTIEILYDVTWDEGLLVTGVGFEWGPNTIVELPTDGTSNWEALGLRRGDIIRIENSSFADEDGMIQGLQNPQGGGNRIFTFFNAHGNSGLDTADIRLLRRPTV